MALWNRRKKGQTVVNVQASLDKELMTRLDESNRLSAETINRASANLIKSNQELIKALNVATREFKKSKSS